MKKQVLAVTVALLVLLNVAALAAVNRYDEQIQQAATQKIQKVKQLKDVSASVEDGIVTLSGTVGLYQDKLDAANKGEEDRQRFRRSQRHYGCGSDRCRQPAGAETSQAGGL